MSRRLSRAPDPAAALAWIAALLEEAGIPYQVVGGLAARAWGATRDLVDIDLYVPDAAVAEVARRAGSRLVRPPLHHSGEHWDLTYLKIEHSGVTVEVAGAGSARYRDTRDGTWCPADIDFEASCRRRVLGSEVPVMPLRRLVAYKAALGREVDARDLEELRAVRPSGGRHV